MTPHFVEELRRHSDAIAAQWSTLLRAQGAASPLANPEMLSQLVPDTVQRIVGEFHDASVKTRSAPLPACDCGLNPYAPFYRAAERAFLDVGINVQFEQAPHERCPQDVLEVGTVVRNVGREEIDAFCDVCVRRRDIAGCRFGFEPARAAQLQSC